MNSSEIVFLETSAVVDLTFKKASSPALQELLKSYPKKVTAHYVRMEIKKGFLCYLVYLHNKIVHAKDWAEVQTAVRKLSSTPQKHRLGSVLEALARASVDVSASQDTSRHQERARLTQ